MAEYVLVVEDEADAREDLSLLLEFRGHRVRTAAHGKEALERISQHGPPCLVILDLMMPVMDGWDFWSALHQDPSLCVVPVVVLSGVADTSIGGKRLDAVAHLEKPCDLENLYRVVETYC